MGWAQGKMGQNGGGKGVTEAGEGGIRCEQLACPLCILKTYHSSLAHAGLRRAKGDHGTKE